MAWFENDHFGALRSSSDRLASLFDWTTPNLVTLAGCLLTIPMTAALLTGHVVIGLVLFLAGVFTDFLDGPLARYQESRLTEVEKRQRERRPLLLRKGQTSEGSAFDPLVDKLRFFGAILPLGWHVLWRAPLIAAIVFAAALTIGRVFVKAKANKFGKLKAAAEMTLVIIVALIALGVPHLSIAANAALIAATLGGSLSLGGQAYTWLKRKNAS